MYIPSGFFTTDLFWSGLKWLMIFVVWAIFALGTWREDRKMREMLRAPLEERDATHLLRTLHRRDLQIWLQVSLLLLIVGANEIHRDAALLPSDFFVPPVAPAAPIPHAKETPPDDRFDKALKNASSPLPFSDITAFNEKNSKEEAYIDWLKERYESWLVSYYYLVKCKTVGTEDYDIIHHALAKDLESVHASGAVEGNILTAAIGSYREMYSDIPCDAAHLSATKSTYDANIQQIKHAPQPNTVNSATPASTKPAVTH